MCSYGNSVIFLGNSTDYRTSIISDIGLKIYDLPHYIPFKNKEEYVQETQKIWNNIEWDIHALDFKKTKRKMIEDFEAFFQKRLTALNESGIPN